MTDDLNIGNESLTPEEQETLKALMNSSPPQEDKQGIFAFFTKILKIKNTIKASNLDNGELGAVRTLNNGADYANVMGLNFVSDYLKDRGEIILSSALSKEGFFVKRVTTQKREIEMGEKRKNKKNWYGKEIKEEGE